MESKKRRWTVFVIAAWIVALGVVSFLAPAPAEARVQEIGWMVYTPNHPAGCAPLAYDCYVVWFWPD